MPDSPTIDPSAVLNGDDPAWDDSTTQHISLGGDFHEAIEKARTEVQRTSVEDKLRGRATQLTFYKEGFLKATERHRGRVTRKHQIDLRYLDTAPTIERRYPKRLLRITAGCAGVAAVLSVLAAFGVLGAFTLPAAAVSISATLVAALWAVYVSHERICFHTLHGRAMALRLGAGLGYIRRYRKLVPVIVNAIEEAGQTVSDETQVYLRSEMREHYRLRSEGVLSDEECSDSTSRILAHFDGPL